MRALFIALGVAMLLTGAVWTLQGLDVLGGSPMSGVEVWAIIGPLLAGLGVGLIVSAARRGT